MEQNNKRNSKICYLVALVFGLFLFKALDGIIFFNDFERVLYGGNVGRNSILAILSFIGCISFIVAGVRYSKKDKNTQNNNNETENQ